MGRLAFFNPSGFLEESDRGRDSIRLSRASEPSFTGFSSTTIASDGGSPAAAKLADRPSARIAQPARTTCFMISMILSHNDDDAGHPEMRPSDRKDALPPFVTRSTAPRTGSIPSKVAEGAWRL
jgi:hypothetical protein